VCLFSVNVKVAKQCVYLISVNVKVAKQCVYLLSVIVKGSKTVPCCCVGACCCFIRGYKDGLQPETLADGNWLVKQNQPVSKIETKCCCFISL
jgi:hypothetical protein